MKIQIVFLKSERPKGNGV